MLLPSETSQISVRSRISRSTDGAGAVPDGVGDQLADDQFGGERRPRPAPRRPAARAQRRGARRPPPGRAGTSQVATCSASSAAGAGEQQGDVVARDGPGSTVAQHARRRSPPGSRSGPRRARGAAGRGRRRCRGRGPRRARRCRGRARLPSGSSTLGGLEGQAAEAQRRPGRQLGEAHGAVRADQDGRRVAGAGHGAAAGDRVVDGVQAGGPGDPRVRAGVRRSARSRSSRATRSSRWVSSSSGGRSRSAKFCTAVRSRPMVAAACRPWPTTSPTTSATRAPDSGMTSNQSPPTPAPAAGR